MLTLNLPEKPVTVQKNKELVIISNGDLRDSANLACWGIQQDYQQRLISILKDRFDREATQVIIPETSEQHGFISSQRQGCDILSNVDENADIIVLITAWQYSHHIASSLASHKGNVLLLANFDGTYPGLVGMLCMAGTLTSLQCSYSRLWSENFNDDFFYSGLESWLTNGEIKHDTSYLTEITLDSPIVNTSAAEIGKKVGEHILKNKEIIGLFDTFCMGMMNGVFPLKSMVDIGLPIESLSQSALLYEMSLVSETEKEECLEWYEAKGIKFLWGKDEETELTRPQVLEQCAMMIAMARFVERFGLTSIGVQYQQGLKDSCAASDFAEGAIGSTQRYPIKNDEGNIIRKGKPIPCINEVDMGTAIPQTMLYRLLDSLNLPAETTLHDIRWGSEYEGTFYWDFEISGAVPFEHIKDEFEGVTGYRQPAMYFPKGGSTIQGQGKAGSLIWARAHYISDQVFMHIGTGEAFELPKEELERRLTATTKEWPLVNVRLDGVERNDLMAGHESNHITIAYVPKEQQREILEAFLAQALTQNIRVFYAF